MRKNEEIAELQDKVSYLNGKCAFLTKRLEEVVLSSEDKTVSRGFSGNPQLEHEVSRLRAENERLERKVTGLYNSVSWRITRPIRSLNFPVIDRWIKGC